MSQSLDLLFDLPRVRRAWPGPKQSLVLEQFDEAGRLRAGIIDAAAKLRLADYARDAALPELSPPESGQLVVHRFGKRAVVIHPDKVRKFLRPNKVAGVVSATRATRGMRRRGHAIRSHYRCDCGQHHHRKTPRRHAAPIGSTRVARLDSLRGTMAGTDPRSSAPALDKSAWPGS